MDTQSDEILWSSRNLAAEKLGVSVATLDRWIKTGRIGHHRWGGRVWVSDEQIEEFTAASERSRWEQPELPFEVAR